MKGKIFKRIAAMSLALLMVGTALPSGTDFTGLFGGSVMSASAQTTSGECGENATCEYDSETGKLTISGTGAMYDYNGDDMPWWDHIYDITSIEIGEGITAIGGWAFTNAENAASVTIPDGVTTIGEAAFAVCGFSSIDIPSTVTSIGPDAFYGSKLINVTIPGGVTVINENVFQGCELLESVVIPQGVTSIGGSAFAGCSSLKTVIIPSTVTSIDDCAFNWCNAVDDIFLLVNDPTNLEWGTGESYFKDGRATKCHVPNGTAEAYRSKFNEDQYNVTFVDDLEEIKCGDNAYWKMTDTDDDGTPDKLTISGIGAMWDFNTDTNIMPWYEYINDIKSVEIADGITQIGDHALRNCSALTSVTIPDSVTEIGDFAFYYCVSLESVSLPENVTSIGEGAFAYCASLKNISIPKSVTTIGNMAFSFCSTLEDLSFADESELETIGEYAFSGCALIESVTIPAGVTSIGEDAFFGCTSCTDVYCLVADPTKLEWTDGGFDDFIYDEDDPDTHNVTRCHVPAQYLADYEEKFSDVNVTFVSDFCGDNAYWTLTDTDKDGTADKLTISGTGDMWDFGGTNPVPYIDYWAGIKTVVISDGITSIGNEAFYQYSAIESVTIADSVTSIGECAFYDCDALKTITIPANVTSIGEHAFDNCSALTTVNYGENSKLKTIGQCAFFGCSAIGSVTIPANVIEIGLFAFRDCKLIKSVTIPAGVTSIGEEAFFGCTSCTDVYCLVADPTKLEWTDGSFDDFIYDEDDPDTHKVTKCHVPKGTVAAYKAKFSTDSLSTDVNVTFVADVTATVADGITHGTVAVDKTEALSGDEITLTVTPSKGYKLKSLTVKDSSGNDVTVTDNKFTMPDLDVTVSAEFEPIDYTVKFNKNGGTGTMSNEAFKYGKAQALTANSFTRTGYIFAGWNTKADGTGNSYADQQSVKNLRATDGKTITLYAQWETAPHDKLEIVTQPQDAIDLKVGDTVNFSVTAKGEGLSYSWYYSDDGETFTKTSQTTSSYTIKMTERRNGRCMYCEIKDKYGDTVTTQTVKMLLQEPLVITTQPKDHIALNEQEKTNFKVEATGEGLKYAWYYADLKSDGTYGAFKKTSCTTSNYKIAVTASRHGRAMYCEITDKFGRSVRTDTVYMYLAGRLRITVQPGDSVVNEYGQYASFVVEAEGSGLTYRWYYSDLQEDGSYSALKETTATSDHYKIKVTSGRVGRRMYCRVTDSNGNSVLSNPAQIVYSPA